jgi:Family of unknown function (DUF6526)
MTKQNYKNHPRYLLLWHVITSLALLTVITGSIVHLVNTKQENKYVAGLLVIISFILIILWIYARQFALRAQDRAIRAEENLRHFILTGKPLDARLRMGQIIALRFASDAEMPELAKRALDQNLKPKQIKVTIENWRADYHRV